MEAQTGAPGELRIVRTRVYFDPDTGDIVHVHRLAVLEGEKLDAERVEEEMSAFSGSMEQRHGRPLESIDVGAGTFNEAVGGAVTFRIDVHARTVVREDPAEAQ